MPNTSKSKKTDSRLVLVPEVVPSEVALKAFIDMLAKPLRIKLKEVTPDFEEVKVLRFPSVTEDTPETKDATKDGDKLYLSTRRLDRDGDIVIPSGLDDSLYKMNPIVLWSHNYREPPVAQTTDLTIDPYGVLVTLDYAPTKFGQDIAKLVKGKFLRTMSAGFIAKEKFYRNEDGFSALLDRFEKEWPEFKHEDRDKVNRIITKWQLVEASFAPIPSNAYSLLQALGKDGGLELADAVWKSLDMAKFDLEQKDAADDAPDVDDAAPVVVKDPAPVAPPPVPIQRIVEIHRVPILKRIVTADEIAEMAKNAVYKMRGKV